MYTAQVHEVTAKLEQQVSSLTAALEDSKQREGLTAHKLSQCEQQLQTVSKLLEVAIQDSLHEEHELQTQLKQVHSLPSTLPSIHQDHLKFVQSMYSSISVVTLVYLANVSRCCVVSTSLFKFRETMSTSAVTLRAAGLTGRRCTTWCAEFSVTLLCVCC